MIVFCAKISALGSNTLYGKNIEKNTSAAVNRIQNEEVRERDLVGFGAVGDGAAEATVPAGWAPQACAYSPLGRALHGCSHCPQAQQNRNDVSCIPCRVEFGVGFLGL